MGELVVVTGPPGAGKSSVSEELAMRWKPSALIPGDAFFGMIKRGYIPPWLPQAQRQNTVTIEAAAAAAGQFCEICFVVYEGVVGPWFLPTFVRATGLANLHYVALLPALDVCIERVRSRVGHGFTDPAVTRDLHHQFAAAAIDARHVIKESESHPAELAEMIRESWVAVPSVTPHPERRWNAAPEKSELEASAPPRGQGRGCVGATPPAGHAGQTKAADRVGYVRCAGELIAVRLEAEQHADQQ